MALAGATGGIPGLNQIKPNDETTPKVYPFAIKTNHPDASIGIVGFRCRRMFLINPYKGIYLKGGRAWVDDIYMGSTLERVTGVKKLV